MSKLFTGVLCLTLTQLLQISIASTVEYEVTFDATWSQQTHPRAITGGAHFSPLIGATHNNEVSFWDSTAIATPGIELMAETGGRSVLQNEIEAAIGQGTAQNLILGSGTSSPGTTSTSFEISESHPLVTLVTMVAPSPDWFVGIHGINFQDNGTWIDNLTVNLNAYDSGTDSGPDFRSANADTNPPKPISLLGEPFAGTPPLGTFTFTLANPPPPIDPETPVDSGPLAIRFVDDFEDGTTQGWTEGNPSPSKPTNVEAGGNPGRFLQNISSGQGGSGSRMVTFNRQQWIGDYIELGVTQIDVDMENLSESNEPLFMRVAVEGPNRTRFGSTEAIPLPADGQWHGLSFGLTENDLSRISGPASFDDVITSVSEIRLVSAEASVAWIGDQIAGHMGLDNITAKGPVVLPQLQAGDSDQDLDFDQFDLVQVQIAAKYLTESDATWGDGDWNGAPGGTQGMPPAGDGRFNQLDVVAALGAGTYLTGPYAALADSPGMPEDAQTSLVYDAGTGELSVDVPAGKDLTSINITSAGMLFRGEKPATLDGAFDNFGADNLFKATFGGSFGSLSFGAVFEPGLLREVLVSDLTVVGSLAGGGELGEVDLVFVPEPAGLVLLFVGSLLVGLSEPCRKGVSLTHKHSRR